MSTHESLSENDPLIAALGALEVTSIDSFATQLISRCALVDGPAGPCFVAFNSTGLCFLELAVAVKDDAERFAEHYRERFGRPLHPLGEAPAIIREVVAGTSDHDESVDLSVLAPFDRAVLEKADEIPRGEVRPYAWIAAEIGRPRAVRAVGSALGRNPVPVVIPCHRVVRSDGVIGNYAFGSSVKVALLRAEGIDIDDRSIRVRGGLRLVASRATHVVCYSTCPIGRQIGASDGVDFETLADARSAGYQPCAHCRPVAGPIRG